MMIGWALDEMHSGNKVRRRGWNGKHQWIGLRNPEPHSDCTVPYVFISTEQDDVVPWLCSQTDLLADDWEPAL